MAGKTTISVWCNGEDFFLIDEYGWTHYINRKDKVKNKVLGLLLPTLRLVDINHKYGTPLFECELRDLHILVGLAYIDSNMLKETVKNTKDLNRIKETLLAVYMSQQMEKTD
jgi:hypothetical protein